MDHCDPQTLAGLALGDDDPDDAAVRHVSSCRECATGVDELRRVIALTRSRGKDAADDGWQRPSDDVWARIERELDASPAPRQPVPVLVSVPPASRAERTPLPEVGSIPGPGRRSARRAAGRARRTTVAWLAAACAAGILIGVGAAWSFWRAPSTTTVASVPLDTLDTLQPLGEAVLQRHDGTLDLRIAMSAPVPGPGYLEVWLLNADGKRMVALGVMGASASTFPVSAELIDKGYVIVDVSREEFDDKPQHSGDSLVRGRLTV